MEKARKYETSYSDRALTIRNIQTTYIITLLYK